MGLHLVALLGVSKLHGAPFVAILAWPFFLKVLFSLRPFHNVIKSVAQDSRLFVFQLTQIISGADNQHERRLERIIRLVHHRVPNIGRSMPFDNYDQSLQALQIVAF
ncbi:hypothetical protein LXL04_018071 [Taraxacum kok-saghyz]